MKYYVIARVNDIDYLTKVDAESHYEAEHLILDLGVCGMHTYGVTACMAYGRKEMKSECFINNAIDAQPIDLENLKQFIADRNAEILEKDAAERRIKEIEKSIKQLQDELEEAKRIFNR